MQFIILSLGCPLPNVFSKEQVSVGFWVYLPQRALALVSPVMSCDIVKEIKEKGHFLDS